MMQKLRNLGAKFKSGGEAVSSLQVHVAKPPDTGVLQRTNAALRSATDATTTAITDAATKIGSIPKVAVGHVVDATKQSVTHAKAKTNDALKSVSDGTKYIASSSVHAAGAAFEASKQLAGVPAEAAAKAASRMFWVAVLGAAVVAFAYGAGNSAPTAVAKYFAAVEVGKRKEQHKDE